MTDVIFRLIQQRLLEELLLSSYRQELLFRKIERTRFESEEKFLNLMDNVKEVARNNVEKFLNG